LDNSKAIQSAAARSAAPAGTAAAPTATATEGHGRGDAETGTGSGVDEVYLDDSTLITEAVVQQKFNSTMFIRRIVFLWLIQSQSQRGTGSPTLHQGNAYGGIDIVIGHVRFKFDNRLLCNFKHPMISSSKGS
jgi:hypothetical protein